MSNVSDAVVIGAGPNGLVAANLLADAGWAVTVIEAQPDVGGAVATDDGVYPGFRHDTFSAFYPLAAASPTMRSLALENFGLRWVHAPAVLGNPLPDGTWALLHRDPEATAAGLDALAPGDGAAWLRFVDMWNTFGGDLINSLLAPFPPVRSAARLAAKLSQAAGLRGPALPLMSADRIGRTYFRGQAPRLLLAGNAMHADFAPTDVGSGIFGMMLTMLGQTVGFPAPAGGASGLAQALRRRFENRGGVVRTNTGVASIVIRSGRAVAVTCTDGSVIDARKAVVGCVSAPMLYADLVGPDQLPARVRWGLKRFRWDPATLKVDWALSRRVPWRPAPTAAPGTVHIAHSVDELAEFARQLKAGLIPADPLLLMGQMTTTDPSRSPVGTESAWAYTHMPQHSVDDAGGEGIRGVWDQSDCERFADRVQRRIERFAPGFSDAIITRRILGPRELEARNASLHGGAIGGGTAKISQELFLRPIPGMGRAETAIERLYLGSSSAHPGGGVHGAAGANAAKAALRHDQRRRWIG